MKVKLKKWMDSLTFVSLDGRPSEEVTDEMIVEFQKSILLCGNPIDPWRINVEITLLETQK